MKPVEWVVLGSSSGMPDPERATSAYLLKLENHSFLFDAGEGVSSSFLRFGEDCGEVAAVFVSHAHPDHCAGLPLLIQMMYLSGRSEPVDIFLPPEMVAPTRSWLDCCYLFPEKMGFDVNLLGFDGNPVFQSHELTVSAFLNSHLQAYAPLVKDTTINTFADRDRSNRLESFHFLIESGGRRILYSGDLGSEDDIEPNLAHLDLAVVEGMHIDVEGLLQTAASSGLEMLMLTHLPPLSSAGMESISQTARKMGISELLFAEDGMKVRIE